MFKKGNKIYAIITGVCPKCHEESMYCNKNPYILTDIFKMHPFCSNCKTKYKMEPSFFYGSMYVSYGVGIAFAVAAFVISYLLLDSSLNKAFWAIVASQFIFYPIIIRVSRNIWINVFIKYDKSKTK